MMVEICGECGAHVYRQKSLIIPMFLSHPCVIRMFLFVQYLTYEPVPHLGFA